MSAYECCIGLEVHVQLKTQSKMFCGCSTTYGAEPNTHVCPVCLGYPGALPVMNEAAIRLTVFSGLMLGCQINRHSKFDRKSYFYPDMPKNYQISQFDQPLCLGGGVDIETEAGGKRIGLTRIHLEEDVGKSTHFKQNSGVDFNRAGVPLMEIVSEPEMASPEEAFAFLVALKQMLAYAGVSECNLEEGNMRCDVNCSVRPRGQQALGTKAELKNLNTFKGALNALHFEVRRQEALIQRGDRVIQETRRWDADTGETYAMRTKEDAHDYRYFPEPDLLPVKLTDEDVEALAGQLPEKPQARRERFVQAYGLPDYDAAVLVADKAVADYFEEAVALSSNPKAVSNWVMTEILRLLGDGDVAVDDLKVTPRALATLVQLVADKTLNSTTAKSVFCILAEEGGDPSQIVKERGMSQVSDTGALDAFVAQAIEENRQSVADYQGGKKAALQFLVGQVMRLSKGKSNPKIVTELLQARLGVDEKESNPA